MLTIRHTGKSFTHGTRYSFSRDMYELIFTEFGLKNDLIMHALAMNASQKSPFESALKCKTYWQSPFPFSAQHTSICPLLLSENYCQYFRDGCSVELELLVPLDNTENVH